MTISIEKTLFNYAASVGLVSKTFGYCDFTKLASRPSQKNESQSQHCRLCLLDLVLALHLMFFLFSPRCPAQGLSHTLLLQKMVWPHNSIQKNGNCLKVCQCKCLPTHLELQQNQTTSHTASETKFQLLTVATVSQSPRRIWLAVFSKFCSNSCLCESCSVLDLAAPDPELLSPPASSTRSIDGG